MTCHFRSLVTKDFASVLPADYCIFSLCLLIEQAVIRRASPGKKLRVASSQKLVRNWEPQSNKIPNASNYCLSLEVDPSPGELSDEMPSPANTLIIAL